MYLVETTGKTEGPLENGRLFSCPEGGGSMGATSQQKELSERELALVDMLGSGTQGRGLSQHGQG